MLNCLSVHPAYSKIHFRIMRAVNPLSHLYINQTHCPIVTKRLLRDLYLLYLKSMNGVIL